MSNTPKTIAMRATKILPGVRAKWCYSYGLAAIWRSPVRKPEQRPTRRTDEATLASTTSFSPRCHALLCSNVVPFPGVNPVEPAQQLHQMITGAWISQAVYVAAKLG